MVTLKDIAKEANVSMMTVSNVVNGHLNRVSKENAERIQAILKEKNYVQNSTARSLAKNRSNIIAVILRHQENENTLKNPHNAILLGTIIQKVQTLGYFAMVALVEDQKDIVKILKGWNARGAIFLGMLDEEIEKIHSLTNIPNVFIDSYSNVRQLSSIGIDDYKGGQLAADYLISMGHTKLAFVGPPDYENGVILHRLNGFVDAISAHGLSFPPEHRLTLDSDVDNRSVINTANALAALRGSITAVFVTSDQMAASLIGQLSTCGIRIPKDLSIIGFDDMPIGSQTTPRLTTIAQDLEQKASLAVDILEKHLKDNSTPAQSLILDVQLVVRESVSAPVANKHP